MQLLWREQCSLPGEHFREVLLSKPMNPWSLVVYPPSYLHPHQPQDLLQVQAEADSNVVKSSGSRVLGDIGQPLWAATFEILLLWN